VKASGTQQVPVASPGTRLAVSEVHLRRLLRVGWRGEVRILVEAEDLGGDVRRESPTRGVVLLDAFVVGKFASDLRIG
jgi:hypothetical protein